MPSCNGSNCGACACSSPKEDCDETKAELRKVEKRLRKVLKENERLRITLEEITKLKTRKPRKKAHKK